MSADLRLPMLTLVMLPLVAGCVEPTHQRSEWESLGQRASAEVWTTTERTGRSLLVEFPQAMERVEAAMSLGRTDSELNRINREAVQGYYRVADRDLFRAVALAVDYAKASGGAYDPTAGSEEPGWQAVVLEREIFAVRFLRPGLRLDLDGLVEGYAVDVAARKFVRTGSLAGLIRLGHDFYAWGDRPGADPWWVEITDPRYPDPRPVLRLRIDFSRGIGLSAANRIPGRPIVDSQTSSDVLFAMAIADSTADAIAISRALLAGGTSRAGEMLSEKVRRVDAVMLVRSGDELQLLASATLKDKLEPVAELAGHEPLFLLPPGELKGRLD